MNDDLTIQLRKTCIALLDDKNGINATGYWQLQSLAIEVQKTAVGVGTGDIFKLVESADGYYYLPETHGLIA